MPESQTTSVQGCTLPVCILSANAVAIVIAIVIAIAIEIAITRAHLRTVYRSDVCQEGSRP